MKAVFDNCNLLLTNYKPNFFQQKKKLENHILMIGDTAGLIHPLCGNGMAMAIHSAKIV
jgi:flavin-dependent dehydrogenase